jgi:hypothetical protein
MSGLRSSVGNPIDGYQFSGTKTDGTYEYFVFINIVGQAIIMRHKTDGTETKYAAATAASALGSLGANSWSSHTFEWFHAA